MLVVAALATVLTLLATHLIGLVISREQIHMDRFGSVTAAALAQLAVEPLMRQDRLHLGVIGNRLGEVPELRGIASYSSDNRVLASTGDMNGPQYSAPVTLDDSIIGYVRVAVEPEAFRREPGGQIAILLLVALLVPLLVGSGWSLAGAARRGELRALLPSRPTWLRPAAPAPVKAVEAEQPPAEPVPEISHYLLAVNLYNQLTLAPHERDFERGLCLELAGAVAELYQGEVVSMPGMGVLLDFDHADDPERPFQVLCAAFVLARLLHDEAPFGHYRLGLNLTTRPAEEALPLDDPAIADAALLSALARQGHLALSEPFHRVVEGTQRLQSRPLLNPLLDQLTTSDTGCHLVTQLDEAAAALVARQVEQIKTQRDAISSPSTF